MLAVEVELLTGCYAATAHNDRRRAEWPPHPARFFSALVAALHDREPVDDGEREALLWLERQPPPALEVDLGVDDRVGRRDVHDVFVPVNDITVTGDVWPLVDAVRSADAVRIVAEQEADGSSKASALKLAANGVAAAEKELSNFLARALTPSDHPPGIEVATAVALMPERRTGRVGSVDVIGRIPRTFPVAVPARSHFVFAWDAEPTAKARATLEALCSRVTRLGHSSSLVRCTIVNRHVNPTLVPSRDGDRVLRVVGEGQLARLEAEYKRHQAVESRVLPARPQRYGHPRPAVTPDMPCSVFADDWIIYERRDGPRPLSSRGTDVARALRSALLQANGSQGPLPSVLSGHTEEGRPFERPHVAFVACPFVGHVHADASVQGCAIVLPRKIDEGDRRQLLRLIATWEKKTAKGDLVELAGDGLPPLSLARVDVSEKLALAPSRWARPSSRFITATPIALDRHPGNLRSNVAGAAHKAAIEAQRSVADACERIGLPRPVSVEISHEPMLAGVQPVRAFRPWPGRVGRAARARVHADIRFGRVVRGPVLLGAGRYFGLGICLPVQD